MFTYAEPRNTHHSVEFSAGGANGGSGVIWKLKVEDKHNDQAVFIFNWNHIDHTVKTNAWRDTQRDNHGKIWMGWQILHVISRDSSRLRQNKNMVAVLFYASI